jgi:hypothetical protein
MCRIPCKELRDLIRTLHLLDKVFTSAFSIYGYTEFASSPGKLTSVELLRGRTMLQAVGRVKSSETAHVSQASPFRKSLPSEFDPEELRDVLFDLYRLLEEYAPSWYSQEHREKAEGALRLKVTGISPE